MITINKINIENVKGIEKHSFTFDGLCANKINLFVAPNGTGKTSIATAFKAAMHGKLKLTKYEYYQGDKDRKSRLEIEYIKDGTKCKCFSDSDKGEISSDFLISVINNPIYPKATGRNFGAFSSRSAELEIKNIEIDHIPTRSIVEYKYSEIKKELGKNINNLSDFFKSEDGLRFIVSKKDDIIKCVKQERVKKLLSESENNANILKKNKNVSSILDSLVKEFRLAEQTAVSYLRQILYVVRINGYDSVNAAYKWKNYEEIKERVERRVSEFNTTKLKIRPSKSRDRLILSLGNAERMSNGERDVLYFVSSLISFECLLKNKPAILIIDEVFDYLDGANLLAAQYYLAKMIENVKKDGKELIPIIMTHLDPMVFSTYRFKRMAVHYLTNRSTIDLNDKIAKLLILRSALRDDKSKQNEIAKYLLHYNHEPYVITKEIKDKLPNEFWDDSDIFRKYLYEQAESYIRDEDYNALAVIIALRQKIEEKIVSALTSEQVEKFYNEYGSKNKLHYAESCGIDLPEPYYLLQPLYNDPLHLYGNDKEKKNKIESTYLKLSSQVIKMMIFEIFKGV